MTLKSVRLIMSRSETPCRVPLGLLTLAVAFTLSWSSLAYGISSRTLVRLTGAAAGDQFGASAASAGDVNGDGFADLIVGAFFNDASGANAGQAYVYYGGPVADAIADLTLTGAAAGDRFGISVASAGDVNGDGFADLIVGAQFNDAGGSNAGRAYVYYGGPGADAIADLTLTGASATDGFGISVAPAGDVNGDGFADLIVGADGNDAGGADAGRAYVYFGGSAPNTIADLTLTGAAAGDRFGFSVASAGDMSGDGFADLVVSAFLNDAGGADAGRAYVYHGGPAADVTADLILTGAAAGDNFGSSVASAGDVNGDGVADLIVGADANDAGGSNAGRAYVYYGSPGADATIDLTLTGAAAGDFFGISVASAGDLNGDGFADLIVGAFQNDAGGTDAGRAYAYYGGPTVDVIADLTLTGSAVLDNFGYLVASAGDVNGDSFADLIVGAHGNDAGGLDAGRAYVMTSRPYEVLSPNGGEQWVAGQPATVRWLGHDLADLALSFDGGANWSAVATGVGGGEMNAFVVSAPGPATTLAKLRVSANGGPVSFATSDLSDGVFRIVLPATPPAAAHRLKLTPTGAAAVDDFGYSVAGAGDVNGDGFADLIVGADRNDGGGVDAGRAYVFYGGPFADAVADLTLTGAAADDFFGYSVAGAGDVNGDGFADVVVGAYRNNAGGPSAGRAYVYFGGAAADAVADLTLTGAATGDFFGSSVAGAGDVSGDGFADLIVGAYSNDAGGTDAGRTYVYDCNRYFVLSPNDDDVWNVGASRSVSWLGAEPADLWLSVDAGRTYDLLRHGVGGGKSNALSLLVPHAPTKFARIKVMPADPEILGLDESDSTFTIQSSVALLNFAASLSEYGAELSWSTEPGVGPSGLLGYRLFRLSAGENGTGARVGPDLIAEPRYTDPGGAPGHAYRLMAVNGLGEELEMGRVALAPAAPLAAWPLPYRGGTLNVSFTIFGAVGAGGGTATVLLLDLSGRLVRTLASGSFTGGHSLITWDGKDERGVSVPNGIYFLRAGSSGVSHRLKVVVMR